MGRALGGRTTDPRVLTPTVKGWPLCTAGGEGEKGGAKDTGGVMSCNNHMATERRRAPLIIIAITRLTPPLTHPTEALAHMCPTHPHIPLAYHTRQNKPWG